MFAEFLAYEDLRVNTIKMPKSRIPFARQRDIGSFVARLPGGKLFFGSGVGLPHGVLVRVDEESVWVGVDDWTLNEWIRLEDRGRVEHAG